MFLQNFYEESDRNNQRRKLIMGSVCLAVFAYIAFIIATCGNEPTQEEVEQSISKSPALSELDRFCQDIPKPSNFKYKLKTLRGNSLTSNIGYWYESDLPFPNVQDFYISFLEKDGWTLEDLWNEPKSALPRLLRYRKGKRTIAVELMRSSDFDYVLDCNLDR